MKKLYSVLLLCCLNGAAFSQTMSAIVNATGAPGSFKTGYVDNAVVPVRIDGDIQAHHELTAPTGDRRGWAVFDLTTAVPPAASISAVNLRFTISGVTDINPATVGVYGYVGDLSTVTSPAAAFAGCNGNGIYTGSNFNGSSWGASPATITLPFNAAGVGFVTNNAPGFISIGWQSNSNSLQTYTITGENGTSATQPQLDITYTCNGVAGVTAAASPAALCNGTTLQLTSTGSGVTTYLWEGPNGYTSNLPNPTLTVSAASAGVYTLTAYNAGGCGTKAYTTPVTINPLPSAIGGPAMVCVSSTVNLTNSSGAGTWVSSNPAVATIGLNSGTAGGVAPGAVTVTFTLASTGCKITRPLSVFAVPTPITGKNAICDGLTTRLSESVNTGTWSSSDVAVATITNAGLVTAVSPGNVTFTYSNGCSPAPTFTLTVNPNPADIIGPGTVCSGSNINLSEATLGGTWSSSNTALATVNSAARVHGVATGAPVITYILPTGCLTTTTILVNPPLDPITGSATVCTGDSITLTNPSAGTWSTANTTRASVGVATGLVKGKTAGIAVIKFTNPCGTSVTFTVTVLPSPVKISGIKSVCNGLTTYLTDLTTGGTWSSDNSVIASIDMSTAEIYGNTIGVTRITYGISNGCIATASFTVTGPPPPNPITGNNIVCVGQNIQLSQETGVGWWQSSNISLAAVDSFTGVVTGTGMGNVNLTYTIGTGNQCTTWKTITVNPLDPITGADSVCKGATTYLADIVGGGTWTSSVPAVAAIDLNTGFVTSNIPGVTLISYTTPLGCITSRNLTVIAIPPAISGPNKTCPGQSITLANANPGGRWSTANAGIATAGAVSGIISGVFPDTVTVFYTVRPGCSTSKLITINPNPAPITGSNGICATTRDTVFDATPGGTWSISPTTRATIDTSGIIQSLAQGSVTITYTLPVTGCWSTLTVDVHPLPISTITFIDSVITLYADTGYEAYQWYGTLSGLIPGANSPSIAGLETQGYYVVVTDSNGCVGTSAIFPFDVQMGINDINGANVRIFPNPATSVIHIGSLQNLRAVITGIDGKIIMEKENAKEMNISPLADGMYFIKLYNGNSQLITTKKFIKQ